MLKLKSIDSVKIGEEIKLPDISELILFPFVSQADFNDLYKNSSESLRKILDKVPLRNNKKYISVNMVTQLLSPNVTAAPRGNWHFDSSSLREEEETYIHLLISDCTALTEFIKDDVILENFDTNSDNKEAEVYVNKNLHLLNPVKIKPNRFYSFNGGAHIHRAIKSSVPELRFTLRVMESDYVESESFKKAIFNESLVFDDGVKDFSTIDIEYISKNKTKPYKSIVKYKDKIELFYN